VLCTTAALLLGLLAAGCGGSKTPAAAASTAGTQTTAFGEGTTSTAAATTGATGAGSTTIELPCDPADFLPVLKAAFDGSAPKLTVVRARVVRCRNGFAQVWAEPDRSVCKPGVGYCYDAEQVFLRWAGDRWRIATSGTGITCGQETDPEIVEICHGLGYPDLTTRSFRMPSRNIGCLLAARRLRCDIRSGLVPQPSGTCDFDWVGVVVGVTGAAAPLCGSDTVYDQRAPTLAYGSTWRRARIVCTSSEDGLACTNRDGHGFTLARERWTTS
jgi:hypothetical protein